MKGAKKDRKNGKDGGGVVAAVTKHTASKFSYVANNKESASETETSSPSVQSPVLKPASVPSNGITAPSPALDAVSATSYTTSTTRSTSDWMRNVPALGSSPGGNLINLMGESPPTQPSSYEDSRGAPYGWSSPRQYYNGGQASSISPPTQSRRPLSYHMDNQYHPSEAYAPSMASLRRGSMHSQTAYARGLANPPLPHQPQAHFYGAPDLDLDFEPKTGMRAGERGYAYGFDTIPTLHGSGSRGKDTAVLTGYEGGLEVHSVTKNGLDTVASLKGLRGGVHYAKILPWTLDAQGADPSPIVAVVVHGPVLPSTGSEAKGDGNYAAGQERSGAASPAGTDIGQRDGTGIRGATVDFYQTTVDLYSLQDSRHIAVLLEGPKIPLKVPITSPIFQAPPPTGALRILADSGNIVIASGQTGESWVYRQATIPHEPGIEFRCVGKLWTSLQQSPDLSQETDRLRNTAQRQAVKAPIIALKGRWIAYCPAAPSSQISLRAAVPVPVQGKAPGLTSLTPPQLPSVVSDVDLPAADSIMNKLMRETTQEVISGAKWIGERGLQAFNNYWNKSAMPSQQARSPPNTQAWPGPFAARAEPPQFPPTHGTMAPAITKEPGLVSIVDVDLSLNASSIHPVTTFATSGCSFLSFAPNGLSLFTASTKGDVQTIWDLMRVQYTKTSPLHAASLPSPSSGPRVRQIAQFSRMTVARIVDVSWMKPNGECVAMVTERGTVHLLDLPTSAFLWPPPRRRASPQETNTNVPETSTSAVSMATGALNSAWDAARPLINRSRRSSSIANAPQTTGSKIVEHANYSSKMIAAGISHSLGKTGHAINQFRHSGDNRISLPPSSSAPGPACVILVANRKDHALFVLGDGLVRAFPQRPRKMSTSDGRQSATRFRRYRDFKLPMLPDDIMAPSVKRLVDPDEYLDLLDKDGDGVNNTMVLTARPKLSRRNPSAESSIPQAEIESSAPYQPFHTDRRVALFEYDLHRAPVASVPQLPTVSVLLTDTHLDDKSVRPSPKRRQAAAAAAAQAAEAEAVKQMAPSDADGAAWAFGQPLTMNRLTHHHHISSEDEAFTIPTDDVRALPQSAMERSVARHRDGGDEEQLVVTTRRRRGRGRTGDMDDEDGFFEDDCEVLDFADQRV
ncbi:hypothetical protein M406DRAFT_284522 [Cryphonectria parasitica EP155]|uniref:BCAS3 domain-containing protein n=1 Tax=Cryphonectria parasitica (strain ATCC 38755 / EP155) TaxID=660469 RepID=A0A9P5CSW0_CRYP1|nr:uncharacterized protein M406DRAFT_284522 [Cryphonectria parasitica EP155]KAF3770014.1 hypothetical protein M406DRAFT_284522 [Cryphonectria parasitica EP155]